MSLITTVPFVLCTKCNQKTGRYYIHHSINDKLCISCLLKSCGGALPEHMFIAVCV